MIRNGRYLGMVAEDARLILYNPRPTQPIRLTLSARASLEPRSVRLLAENRELTNWKVGPGKMSSLVSPPFSLPEGLHTLSLVSDGSSRPPKPKYAPVEGRLDPFSLWVSGLRVEGLAKDESTRMIAQQPTEVR